MTPTIDPAALRTRYAANYQPICGGCGQLMRCILWRVFKCDGKVKIGRRWTDCQAPEQWERPNEQTRREVLALLDQLPRQRVKRQPAEPPPPDLFSSLDAPSAHGAEATR